MSPPTPESLIAIREELRGLEERVGIAPEIAGAQLGPMAPDVTISAEESFTENQRSAKQRGRELYFGIQDVAVRKELIRQRRECRSLYEACLHRNLTTAQTTLALAQRRASGAEPWFQAAGAGALAALNLMMVFRFSLYLAAVFGVFAGQGFILRERERRSADVSAAQAKLEEERKNAALYPDWFSASEESSGERDKTLDRA